MRRVSPLRLTTLALILASVSLLSLQGCADNESSLFIAGVLAPPDPGAGSCVAEPDPDNALLAAGILDVAVTAIYRMPLLIGNQLVPRGNQDKLRTETGRIILRGAVVTVSTAAGAELGSFTTNATGFIDVSSGTDPGWGVSFVNAVPNSLDLGIPLNESRELSVAVSVFGDTLGGQEVESSTLTFPLFACNGCLVDCSTANPATMSCQSSPEGGLDVPCRPGQDQITPCQFARDSGICGG